MKIPIPIITIVWCTLAACTAAAENAHSCTDHEMLEAGLSVSELVGRSKFIGLYKVIGSSKVANNSGGGVDLVDYSMRRISRVYGEGPAEIEIRGLPPYTSVPQLYFDIDKLHDAIPSDDPTRFGLAQLVPGIDGRCFFAPKFVESFTYLILGGVDSQVSFEPIAIAQFDSWYRLILAEAQRDSSPKRQERK